MSITSHDRVAVQATLEDSFDFAAGQVRRLLATYPADYYPM